LNLEDPLLSGSVAFFGLSAGVMEEIVFRGLILFALIFHWGKGTSGLTKSVALSSFLFSMPHVLNLLMSSDPGFVLAQIVWAFLLGAVFAGLLIAGGNLWAVMAAHGFLNVFMHLNRLGTTVTPRGLNAVLMAIAPIPLVLYVWFLMKRKQG